MFNPIVNSSNDDDIFDDSKSLSDNDQNFTTSQNNEVNSEDLVQMLNQALSDSLDGKATPESLEKLMSHLAEHHDIKFDKLFNNMRYNLIETFYEAYYRWMSAYRKNRTSMSVYSALTDLTEGRYPLYDKYFELELNILKRFVVLEFLEGTFLSENANTIFPRLGNIFNIDLDQKFIKTYYTSMHDLIRFTLTQEIAVYKALATELDLEAKPEVINGTADISSVQGDKRKEEMFKKALTPYTKELISKEIISIMSSYE